MDSKSGELYGAVEMNQTLEKVSVSYSPSGTYLLVGSVGHPLRVWETESNECFSIRDSLDRTIYGLPAIHPDGKSFLTVSEDDGTKIWHEEDSGLVASLVGDKSWGDIRRAKYSPDGEFIVTTAFEAVALVRDSKTGKPVCILEGHADAVLSAEYSLDCSKIITASFDRTARVWNSQTGQCIDVLKGHPYAVISASYRCDGEQIITISSNLLIVWNAKTGKRIGVVPQYPGVNIVDCSFKGTVFPDEKFKAVIQQYGGTVV
jgi:WD40 repeat protein